jgi:hypothetical protein
MDYSTYIRNAIFQFRERVSLYQDKNGFNADTNNFIYFSDEMLFLYEANAYSKVNPIKDEDAEYILSYIQNADNVYKDFK